MNFIPDFIVWVLLPAGLYCVLGLYIIYVELKRRAERNE